MKKPIFIALLLLAGGLACWFLIASRQDSSRAGASGANPAAEPLSVILLSSTNGAWGSFGDAAAQGMSIGVTETNGRGGVFGRPLKMSRVYSDSIRERSELETALGKPLFVVVADDEHSVRAALSWGADVRVPVLSITDGPCPTVLGGSDKTSAMAWSFGLSWEMSVEPLLIHLAEKYSTPGKEFNLFFVAGETPNNVALAEYTKTAAEDLGFKTAGVQTYDQRLTDYYNQLRAIVSHPPNILFLANPGDAGNLMLEQATKLGLSKEMVIAGLVSLAPELTTQIRPAVEGMVTVGSYEASNKRSQNQKFIEAGKPVGNQVGFVPTPAMVSAYSAVMMSAHAFDKSGTPDSGAFASRLEGLEFEAPNGIVKMNAENHVLEQPLYIYQIKNGEYRVVESLGTAIHPKLDGCHRTVTEATSDAEDSESGE